MTFKNKIKKTETIGRCPDIPCWHGLETGQIPLVVFFFSACSLDIPRTIGISTRKSWGASVYKNRGKADLHYIIGGVSWFCRPLFRIIPLSEPSWSGGTRLPEFQGVWVVWMACSIANVACNWSHRNFRCGVECWWLLTYALYFQLLSSSLKCSLNSVSPSHWVSDLLVVRKVLTFHQ